MNLTLPMDVFFQQPFSRSLYCKHVHVLVSPSIFTGQWKNKLARFLRLPANQLHAVFPCLCSRSQSIFTCNSVKLLDTSTYFYNSIWLKKQENVLVGNFKQMNYFKHPTQLKNCFPEERKITLKMQSTSLSANSWAQ